jgi:hypothetical protein
MKVVAATPEHVYAVASVMRQHDRQEFMAVSQFAKHHELVESLVKRFGGHPDAIMGGLDDGTPLCVGGLIQHRPHVATLLFFATDGFDQIGRDFTRFVKQRLFPGYVAKGVHRIECSSIEGYEEAHQWIVFLGLKREAEMRKFGRGGETYLQFAWVAE